MGLEDDTVIITGSSRGIGRAIAKELGKRGARIVIVARKAGPCEVVAEQIRSAGGQAAAISADVSSEAQVDRLVRETRRLFGDLSGLVNAAGVGMLLPLRETSLATWQRTLDVNLTGTFLCCRAVWHPMIERGGGTILNIASSAVREPHAGWGAYLASKAGVVALTKVLAKEGWRSGIRVNALLPGATATKMRRRNFPDDDPDELLSPEEVASAAPFFFSEAAQHLFGELLEVRRKPRR